MINYISERWPGGEYELEQPCTSARVLDEVMYSQIQGKDQQYYIMLPPGYDENPERRYPVLYLVHGIGMSASDLTATILFADPWMQEGLIQQFIVVFPDASCKEDCFSGTFMANQLGRNQEGYRYEDSFFQELIPHIDEHYRTRPPEDFYR
jgi:enterochelin esterase-like enzyme